MRRLIVALLGFALACQAPPPVVPTSAPEATPPVLEVVVDAPRVFGDIEFSEEELAVLLASGLPDQPPTDPTNRYSDDPAAAAFGRRFFFDERFSETGAVSCATCHDPTRSWSDGRQIAEGVTLGLRHTPSLWNVGFQRWFFWDGRADSLWAQALSPLENEFEHATTRLAVVHALAEDETFRRDYEAAFGPLPDVSDELRFPRTGRPIPADPEHPDHVLWSSMSAADQDAVTAAFVNVGKALGAFQRRIVSNDAPFDRFARGVRDADVRAQRVLSSGARRGFKLFQGKARCHLCHHGPNFSDLEFHNTRVPSLEGGTSLDGGRFTGIDGLLEGEFTGISRWSDDTTGVAEAKVAYIDRTGHNWAEFKTPTLRNVAVSAPYMHNGRFATLEDVVRFYSTLEEAAPVHHRGENLLAATHLTKGEIRDLVSFLESLTDASVEPELLAPRPSELPQAESAAQGVDPNLGG